MLIGLKQGDCVEVMKGMEDESIDLIVTDPPYLMRYKSSMRKDKNHDFCTEIKNDNNREVIINSINEMHRVLKKNSAMYLFCNSNKVDVFKREVEKAGFNIKNIIVWVKNAHTAGDLKAAYGKKYEFIIYANKGRKFINGKRLPDVWKFNRVAGKKQLHQNEKPLELIEQCVLKSSNKNDLILDAFMGSGTTGVACKNLNRRFIGIELEEKYFEIAKKRIEETEGNNG